MSDSLRRVMAAEIYLLTSTGKRSSSASEIFDVFTSCVKKFEEKYDLEKSA